MFIVLSKLLPVFLYPLGLASVLLAIALFCLWRERRHPSSRRGKQQIVPLAVGLALTVLLLSGCPAISGLLVRSLEYRHVPTGELPKAEAIVVLGGSVKPQIAPRPWLDVSEAGDRVLHGARLFLQGKAPLIIFSGGGVPWLSESDRPEAPDMAELAGALGVPAGATIQELQSRNTRENAVKVQAILQQRHINRILLVTSALHMPRSLAIFQKLGIATIPAPTDFLSVENTDDSLVGRLLGLLPEADALKNTTNAMKEYVGWLVYRLQGWA